MEKENLELTETAAGKPETQRSKHRKPEAIGSLAIEPETAESSRKRHPAPEARRLHDTPPAPEHIGHMLMSAETKTDKKPAPEKAARRDVSAELKGRHVETLNRAELMTLSEQIIIDGSSLRQIYETHLIGERGLRRLVTEYLQGGDLKQALRREVVERERDFERDPVMRDMTPEQVSGGSVPALSRHAALDKLLEQADFGADDRGEEAAFFKARARYEAMELHQHKQRRRVMDIGLGAAIVLLILLVIALFLSRS